MIAVTGGKGGSGKTTTALGLATTLARRGTDPIVVDCDCDMPDIHHRAGVDLAAGVDALADSVAVESVSVQSTTLPGVRLVTAGKRENVSPALRELEAWPGPVFLDCPPGTGPDATRPLRHATASVVVTTDRPQSVADARRTIQVAENLNAGVGSVVFRETGVENEREPPTDRQSIIRVPTVSEPLAHPGVRARWAKLGRQLGLRLDDVSADLS